MNNTFLSKEWFGENENRPYIVAGVALALGLIIGALIMRTIDKKKNM